MSVATLEPTAAVQTQTAPHPKAQFERYDTIQTSRIVVFGFLSAILTFVVILAAQAVFFAADHGESQRKAALAAQTPLTNGLSEQQNRLAGYGWVDPAKGMVNIPVDDAMKLVLTEQQTGQQKSQPKEGAAGQ